MHAARGFGVERESELLVPVEGVAGVRDGVVAVACAGAMAGNISRVGGDLVGDDAVLDVLFVGQAEVLFRGDVAEHRRAVPADHGRADGRGDVVVAGGDVGDQRAENVERRAVAELDFLVDLLLDLVHGHVAGAFDHDLHVVLPGLAGELAEGLEFGKLRLVGGIRDGAGTEAVAERVADVVLGHELGDAVEVFVEEVLLVVRGHPLGEDGAAAADDPGDALRDQRHVLNQHAGVDGEVVDALLRLLFDDLEVDIDVEVFDAA